MGCGLQISNTQFLNYWKFAFAFAFAFAFDLDLDLELELELEYALLLFVSKIKSDRNFYFQQVKKVNG